ncbi:MAG TPA: hypothetical protein VMU19_14800 [Bryobacteraceae bacterium]|nr:hypothetical protein [Bryobacteraceae bacterium]
MLPKSGGLLVLFLAPVFAANAGSGLTVHEWGTFTSVAAEDGSATPWVSLAPPADLPCFVYHLTDQCVKCGLNKVRMETPVLYFYSGKPMTAAVHVDLPNGLITEWYPRATMGTVPGQGYTYGAGGNIDWSHVQILPGDTAEYPNAGDKSHYYAARETDSAGLRVGEQAEKVLFYRGVANFDVPVAPRFLPDGRVEIRNEGSEPIGFAMLFENRDGKVGYRLIRGLSGAQVVAEPELTSSTEAVKQELSQALVAAGLFPKEAAAMIETWRDSWFEEGARVYYIMPRIKVDAVLPIAITPAPESIERVFVGRVEALSPAMHQSIETALKAGDTGSLAKWGRFALPFARQIAVNPAPAASQYLSEAQRRLYETSEAAAPVCRSETRAIPTK